MENASNALKTAFAIFVFVIALSILISIIAQINSYANIVFLYTDKTNFYNYKTGEKNIVTEEEIISTLYNMKNNKAHIYIYKGSNRIFPISGDLTLKEFINKELKSGKTYNKEVVEVNTKGIYKFAEDETKITLKRR